MKKIIDLPQIGKVEITKRKAARRISISVKPGNQVKMTIPFYTSYKTGERFLTEKTHWIKSALNKINSRQTIFKPWTSFNTYSHSLKFITSNTISGFHKKVTGNELVITFNESLDFERDEVQKFIRDSLDTVMRNEAKEVLPQRVKTLAGKYGFSYNKVFIKNTKTRWGSCSVQNNINLCLQLMRLPDNLINYVILHELVHTVHKNHSKNFWKLLDDVSGNARGLDKLLKEYSISVY